MKQTTQANFYLIILFLCCASIFASNITDNYGKKVLEKSPVLYLRFDGSYSDSSQNGFDATADGNVSTVSKSDFTGFSSNNKAAYLTGGWLKVSSLTKSNLPNKLPNTLTTEAWVSATQFQTWTSYIGYYQDNGHYEKGWWLGANNSKAIFPVAANLNNLNYDPGYSGMELNTWYYIVGVYDGSKVKIYINGDYVTEHSRSGDHDYNHGTYGNDYLRIGIYKDYDEHFAFKGYIDEVAIYDYALSSAEIKEHYDIATIDLAVSLVAISSATNIQSGILNAGDSVTVTVTMSEPTTVSGTPQIGLQIGNTTVQADYASGSGSTDLLFVYMIQAGQTDPDGISIDADSLTLNNGSLTDTAGNNSNATLTHTAVIANNSYKVDTTAPTISSVAAGWGPSLNATEDDSVGTVAVVTSGVENGQTVTIVLNGTNYTGKISNNSTSVAIAAADLQALINGSNYTLKTNVSDVAGNVATENTATSFSVDTTAPTASSISISSAINTQSGILNAGDSVTVTVTMSEPTTVSGTPQISLQIGSTTVQADYASGSGSTDLLFVYVIQAGQTDLDGISIDADSLTFNNGSLADTAGNNATLTHTAVVANSSYKVDTTATISLLRGVNMIGLPLKPDVSYTAKSLSQHLASNSDNLNDDSAVDVTWVIRYPSSNKKFEAYVWSLDQTHDGFEIQGGRGYIVHVSSGRDVVFEGGPWSGVLNPISAPSSVIFSNTWAFVVSGNLTSQIVSSDEGYRLQATNLTTGKQLAEFESIGHSFRLPLVDLNRQDLVVEGDLVAVKLIDSNGRRRANSRFQVGQKELATAHRWLELESNPVPDLTRLLQNYPNPFNPETWIPYQLSQDSEVKIWIYDVGGQLVRSMEVGFQEAGIYSSRVKAIYWDGKNQDGEPVSSGVYFYILEMGTESQTKQMVILK